MDLVTAPGYVQDDDLLKHQITLALITCTSFDNRFPETRH